VGDSRVYLLRNGALKQLTKDHSYVQEQVDLGNLTPEQARYHPYSNVITRCVGASPDVEPDLYAGDAQTGDVFLVASDGLTGMVDDRRLAQTTDLARGARTQSPSVDLGGEWPRGPRQHHRDRRARGRSGRHAGRITAR